MGTKRINILGYEDRFYGKESFVHHGIEHMEKEGYEGVYVNEAFLDEASKNAAFNWVISAYGLPLAEKMKKDYGIPYVKALPVGAVSMALWQKDIFGAIDEGFKIMVPKEAMENENQPKICVIAEPLHAMGVAKSLKNEFGLLNVKKYIYCKDEEMKEFYRKVLPNAKVSYFTSDEELKELAKDDEIVIADPELLKLFSEKKTVSLPYPLISGEKYLDTGYLIFGKKGAAYLRRQLSQYISTLPEVPMMGC